MKTAATYLTPKQERNLCPPFTEVALNHHVDLRRRPHPSGSVRGASRQFEDWPDVTIVLDRREGERRTPHDTFAGVERRRGERRHRLEPHMSKLGWAVVDTDELVS